MTFFSATVGALLETIYAWLAVTSKDSTLPTNGREARQEQDLHDAAIAAPRARVRLGVWRS